jgi:hypothetical protein
MPDDSYELVFTSYNTFLSSADHVIDNLVVSIPEPSAVLLLLSGLAALCFVRRR